MSILLVDSYDSFTYNLRSLITTTTKAHVITIHNDSYNLDSETDKISLNKLLDSVDAVVIGPGPGSPSNPSDVGIIPYIFNSCQAKPILGICLGFQIFCLLNDCSVHYLEKPVHGQVHKIKILDDTSIFKNTPDMIESVRYHSIYVKQDSSKLIVPLGVYNSSDNEDTDDSKNESILMAARHVEFPHFGVQYHPESICSKFGSNLIKNFWNMVDTNKSSKNFDALKETHLVESYPLIKEFSSELSDFEYNYSSFISETPYEILDICDTLKYNDLDIMILNSASAPGDWSIIGLPTKDISDVITHSTENPNIIKLSKWKNKTFKEVPTNDVLESLATYMSKRYFDPIIDNNELKKCPFVGGLIGYISYEEGSFVNTQTLEKRTENHIDDTKFCFIDRFIAISPCNKIFVISIRKNDANFLSHLNTILSKTEKSDDTIAKDELFKTSKIILPNKDQYFKSFHDCQKYLHSGDSYELCLTYNTIVQIPDTFKPWDIYKALVKKNPSPYSAYMNFESSMLLSTSPERFISWNDSFCQMRPIKGTLKKKPNIDYQKACELLKIPKELGENLMIVDLIRDNLLYLLDEIEVTKLMSVEEYETIYQLVSVIEGQFTNKFTGIDVLKNSLPPGSMTGAPKKRSVEILQEIEQQQRRGLYSGICGYWSLNNNADWSVIIRSLFRYTDDLCTEKGYDTYRCGAGGALTVLSTDEGEWDEMLVKLHSVLQLFE